MLASAMLVGAGHPAQRCPCIETRPRSAVVVDCGPAGVGARLSRLHTHPRDVAMKIAAALSSRGAKNYETLNLTGATRHAARGPVGVFCKLGLKKNASSEEPPPAGYSSHQRDFFVMVVLF